MGKNESQMPKILLIGPLAGAESATNIIGGDKVMMANTAHQLRLMGFTPDTIDTSGGVTNLPLWKIRAIRMVRFLRVVWGVASKCRRDQIVFLITPSFSALILASTIWVICKITRRPMVLRITGTGLIQTYRTYGALARWLADRTYLRCALVYLETHELCRFFNDRANVRWFPNTRDIKAPDRVRRDKINKLIFLARLEMDKGLGEALEACRHLPENCHLTVFGPRTSDADFSLFDDHPRATYGGVLDPAEVPRAFSEHDLLVFPSYFKNEGYPGSILEAFQCGLPVVAARWGGVPELVEHEENGLLVEPRCAAGLKAAIQRLLEDPGLYRRLCEGAERRGDYFRNANWYDRVAEELRNLRRQ